MNWPLSPFRSQQPCARRTFLIATSSLASAAFFSAKADDPILKNIKLKDYPFQLGVASGDPSDNGFVIWTRLAPEPLAGGGMPQVAVEVGWEIASDDKFTNVIQSGKTVATPDWAHSVHVEVAGLQPEQWYFYRFHVAGETSPVGRARTFPAAETLAEKLRFAFASCQHYEHGLYTAYEHMIKADLDFVAFLGDYIYEYATAEKKVRRHNSKEIETLEEYRNRHALYKTDKSLQAAHAHCPWLVTWDDHEFDNNCAGDISEEKKVETAPFLVRRAQAYKAYYEHMPLRRAALPQGPHMKLYRQVSFGRLADFYVLDTRQYRTDQPCGDGNKFPCDDVYKPDATLLGADQENWLFNSATQSKARWNVMTQQIMMARIDRAAGDPITHSMDQWPGYEVNRHRILKAFSAGKISNPVVIAGDIHSNWANDLLLEEKNQPPKIVGSEFVGTSISSGGDGKPFPKDYDLLMAENPCLKFHNTERGYVECEVTPKLWRTDYKTVEYVTKTGAPLQSRGTFVVEDQHPGVKHG